VGLRVTQMQVAIEAVLTGGYVAVLPDLVARRFALRSLEVEGVEPSALYMVHRPSLVERGRTEVLVEHLRQAWEALGEGFPVDH
jgi:DNA-binding transcriptional LysR family regulator